ncbi:MAG: hypothetical protein EOM91_09860 [Sphingobacteriia bacterium]|nr:hypothetical protein [Sphingobacteriia bacterium]NCC38106.1 hypothetical protein [Gammaproteobacteria bacterium]
MSRHIMIGLLATTVALGLVACGQDAPAPVQEEQPAAPVAEPMAPAEQESIIDKAKGFSEQLSEQASEALDAVPGMVETVVGEAVGLRDAGADQAAALVEEAKTLIGEERMDQARALLDQVSAMQDSLSADLQAEIERLKAMLPSE